LILELPPMQVIKSNKFQHDNNFYYPPEYDNKFEYKGSEISELIQNGIK
jgi:hypothetical protein